MQINPIQGFRVSFQGYVCSLYLFNSDTEQWGTKYIDACIAKIVNALQTHGIKMVSSCCGHHHRDGWIQLADGRLLKISKGE
ncbi:MAG TPA: hypothetical protein ENH82_00380 [bacterium]|nr:hypothetical protein [bacterium]